MADKITENIIDEINKTLKSRYPDFYGSYLFGSRARGDSKIDSDLDLAIIFKRKIEQKLKSEISRIIADFMLKYEIIIDNPVFSYSDIIEPKMPLTENILKQGVFYG